MILISCLHACMQLAFLRRTAGAAAVPCPQINIGSSFDTIIQAALESRAGNSVFSPYDNDVNFLLSAYPPLYLCNIIGNPFEALLALHEAICI